MMEMHGCEDLFEVEVEGGGWLRAILPVGSQIWQGDSVDWGVAIDCIFAFLP